MSALESAFERQNLRSAKAVPAEGFPATHIYGDFIYERFRVNHRNLWYLRHKAKPFEDELGFDAFRSPDEVRHNIRLGGEIIFVMPARGIDKGKDIAVAARETRDGVLVTGVVVVHKNYQRKGIGKHLAEDAILRLKPRAATGRTRRWEVPRIYEGLEYRGERLVGAISPIDTNGRLSQEAQEKLPVILEKEERRKLNLEKGLYADDTYPRLLGADAKDSRPPRNNPAGARIFDAMKDLGIDPARGNGLRYWLEINHDVLERASAAYNPREVVFIPTRSLLTRIKAAIFGLPLLARMQPSLASFKK